MRIKAYDKDMRQFIMEAEEVLARVILHENDHLDGHLYPEKAEGPLLDIEEIDEDQDVEIKGKKPLSLEWL